ncbi:MAG: nitroreductase family protein [Armatimonadetes bacterium]|nr:nitroreductase family protein [Anaerolineae bacterium]
MNVQQAIETKRAVRLFTPDPVPAEMIDAILDAGRRSQSSKNTQPWQFVVVQQREMLLALSRTGDFAGHLAGAAFGVALVAPNDNAWTMFDLGQAAAYMQLAAWEVGIGSCIAAIYDPAAAQAILNIPADYMLRCALSFGYPSPDHIPAKMGGRKPLTAITHWETW